MEHSQLFKTLTLHALLHLQFQIQSNPRTLLSTAKKNEALVRWFKPKLKLNKYKSIRKQIKLFVQLNKHSNANLERFLEGLVLGEDGKPGYPHLDGYLLLINEVEKKLGTTVVLSTPEALDLDHNKNGCLVAVLSQDLNVHFNDTNQLQVGIPMLFRGNQSHRHTFLGAIYANSQFDYDVDYEDEHFIRILLKVSD
ncbi:conserved hypothetical protein [Vibrio nigripulchritudo SFn27]|uniref:DUF2913 domain-containing protein n=1 Tax=Vibrio nigripulchritudo TaxID=28173 RepID=U4K2U7_9VIBR|nr:DUF2913 family protein [Vibrio nigripulchritudo]CCN81699.1 conserved hypothetical protein [Vibrio nigripulchritudo BLFn1]CCN91518.1 conserved hypothetical protein [Vibrio nigripulchritudo SFn27]CCN95659.1 conserved hypothetical protein [Vibrio nigripulchritudo ENn2]CCO39502.1 conserved hypothetical protein [Vibrio nigripulchritudo SFn135]CCO51154.1 conserved hypothetical protein [Vibrio nigripulchritudo Wn13]